MLNVYGDFVQKYPSPESILDTPQEELADDIESLGLRKRTRYFREASDQLVVKYDSTVPNTRSELLELQGVGEYTATSVLAHAFEKDVAAVDTNVARILCRVFGHDCGDKPEASENWELAEDLLPQDEAAITFTRSSISALRSVRQVIRIVRAVIWRVSANSVQKNRHKNQYTVLRRYSRNYF